MLLASLLSLSRLKFLLPCLLACLLVLVVKNVKGQLVTAWFAFSFRTTAELQSHADEVFESPQLRKGETSHSLLFVLPTKRQPTIFKLPSSTSCGCVSRWQQARSLADQVSSLNMSAPVRFVDEYSNQITQQQLTTVRDVSDRVPFWSCPFRAVVVFGMLFANCDFVCDILSFDQRRSIVGRSWVPCFLCFDSSPRLPLCLICVCFDFGALVSVSRINSCCCSVCRTLAS